MADPRVVSRSQTHTRERGSGNLQYMDLCCRRYTAAPIRLQIYWITSLLHGRFRFFISWMTANPRVRRDKTKSVMSRMDKWSLQEISSSATIAATSLGYQSLRSEQKEAIATFLRGNDVFVALPTGYGKNLCYGCLPLAFDVLWGTEKKSIAIVLSPLVALMKDQVSMFLSKGLSSAFISSDSPREMQLGVLSGDYQLVFFSPESILSNRKWRDLLRQEPYVSQIVALVVDEAHCVKKW